MEIRVSNYPWPAMQQPGPAKQQVVIQPVSAKPSNPIHHAMLRLKEAEQLRLEGRLDRAQKICERLLREHPDYVGGLHTFGLVLADKGNFQHALNYLIRAAMLNPRSWTTFTALSGIYLALEAPEMAAQALEQARAINPNDSNVLTTLGEIYRDEREYELAREAYRQALAIEPELEPAAVGLGWVCQHMGHDAEAVASLEPLVKRGIRELDVLHALTHLPAPLVSIDVLAEIGKTAPPKKDKSQFEITLAFVRATALEKAGRRAEAWQHVVPANRAVFSEMQRHRQEQRENEQTILAQLRNIACGPQAAATNGGEQPISLFILGPSRSGKTSMEKLVGTLAGVKRGYENPIVENAVRRTFQGAWLLTSRYFEDLPPQLRPMCCEVYAEELARRAGPAKVFTNTHPGRIFDAPLMASIFPKVRFIFVKRNVDDIILRMYMRQYRRGNAYAYDLKAARDHVLWYQEMMDLMAEKRPDIVRVINYEEMVVDPAGALRVAAELCGLPMEHSPLPALGDDRGCAEPYREFMAAELQR